LGKPVYISGIKYLYSTPKRVDKADSLGEANYKNKTIKVRNKSGQIGLNTLIHEVIHVSAYEHSSHNISQLDEKDVDVLGNEIAGVLRQLGVVK
jgi:hypothetical protein